MRRRWPRRADDGRDGRRRWPGALIAVALGLSLATAVLVGLAWTATAEMRRSTALVLERRAGEMLALTFAALNRDMKGAWLSVLTPLALDDVEEDPPYDLLLRTGQAFARFPYPESFIVWTAAGGGRTYVFNRTERPAPWDTVNREEDPYPVTLIADPPALAPIVADIRAARTSRRFALVDTTVGGVPYHVVVHRFAGPAADGTLAGFAAFTVNLDWVRREYFAELLPQLSGIDGDAGAMAIAVLDDRGTVVAASGAAAADGPIRRRNFPLLFIEPALVVEPPPAPSPVRSWAAQVQPSAAMTSAASQLGTEVLLIASLAGAASLVAVLLTVRATRASAELADMKSEFVSAVTHELKTPLALIKLVGETLERGRYTSADTIRDYAAILSQEERRLSHLIENLLTYSRLSDVREAYTREPLDVAELIEDALQPFRLRLKELGFALTVDVDPGLPRIDGDRASLVQAFANVIDNAVKYSRGDTQSLDVAAQATPDGVCVRFADAGIGIPEDELPRVVEKFYRGRDTRESGSGLGLTIVRRIVQQHGGRVDIRSTVGRGTTVALTLPARAA